MIAAHESVGTRLGAIWDEARRITLAAKSAALVYVVTLAAGSTLVDVMGWNSGGDQAINLASIGLGYFLTVSMLQAAGLERGGARYGFWTYFGINLLSGLGIALGLVALIIPGLFLLARWSAAYGYGLTDGGGVMNGLRQSWDATADHWLPAGLAMGIPIGLYLIGAAFYGLMEVDAAAQWLLSLIGSLALFSGSLAVTAIGLAVFALTNDDTSELTGIFE